MMQNYINSLKDLVENGDVLEAAKSKFESLTWKQQVLLVTIGACGLGGTLLYAKKQHDFSRELENLKEQGYYPTDALTSLLRACDECNVTNNNTPILNSLTVNGIFVCNNARSFTYSQCMEYWANISMEYLSFRSVLESKLNTYFWIECSNENNTFKINNKLNESNIINEIKDDNVEITSNINRLQFYEKYGFDIASMIKYFEIDMSINDFNDSKYHRNHTSSDTTTGATPNDLSIKQDKSGIIYTIDDGLMDYVLDLMQEENNEYELKLQEEWYLKYTKNNKPNWNIIYFNFINLNKCVVLVQWNHTLCDGVLFSQITENMSQKMYDKHNNNNFVIQSLEVSTHGNDSYAQLLTPRNNNTTTNNTANNKNKNKTSKQNNEKNELKLKLSLGNRILNSIYWYLTIPISFYKVIINPVHCSKDPKYPSFSDKISRKVFVQFGPTISLDVFKKVAKSQNGRGTINDLLLAVTCRAVSAYLKSQKDSVFKDNINGKDMLSCAQVQSVRDIHSSNNSEENIKNGLACNLTVFGSEYLPISSNVTSNDINKHLQLLKYGSLRSINSSAMNAVKYNVKSIANDPNGTLVGNKIFDYDNCLGFSNFQGPKNIIPVGLDSNGDNDSYMTRFHAHTVVRVYPIWITFVTYNNLCKFTIVTDQLFVKDPKQFKQCWFDEWTKYANSYQ